MKSFRAVAFFLLFLLPLSSSFTQDSSTETELDRRVRKFLADHEYDWHDMNVPPEDGKFLYDMIVTRNFKSALEIGTSTGHSAIWIAWALSKTGGKLITIEIEESRYHTALENFKEAGLSQYIDARLADAHELVPELKGPFDFAFCDADKEWYTNYFKAVSPKLKVGGCYTAHNVSERGWGPRGIREFVRYVRTLDNYTTTIQTGISVSCKTSAD